MYTCMFLRKVEGLNQLMGVAYKQTCDQAIADQDDEFSLWKGKLR